MRILALALAFAVTAPAQNTNATIPTARFTSEVDGFLGKEMAAHIADIKSISPPPSRVVGALTVGEFSWGTFMRSAAVNSQLVGADSIAG